jgi:hypothetical protein
MSTSTIVIVALALVFIIGGPIVGSYANKASQKENIKKTDK